MSVSIWWIISRHRRLSCERVSVEHVAFFLDMRWICNRHLRVGVEQEITNVSMNRSRLDEAEIGSEIALAHRHDEVVAAPVVVRQLHVDVRRLAHLEVRAEVM